MARSAGWGNRWNRRDFLLLSVCGLASTPGCHDLWSDRSVTRKIQSRSQIGDDPALDLDDSTTIGSKSTVGNTEPIPVSGVGLVSNLPGTGSSAPPGSWRTMLEQSLKKQGVSNVREFLDDPHKRTSLVLVSALIPPGARKGELIDVEVTLPEESKTVSLKGGYLHHCELYTYETTGNLRAMMREGKR
ncbi:MAG: flagellar basal body P-ring protein FlgI, partial [Gemmataceae bacterium]|nr:flagellar basal body P-ring protein FlgI [Gemmataceae bacterium]